MTRWLAPLSRLFCVHPAVYIHICVYMYIHYYTYIYINSYICIYMCICIYICYDSFVRRLLAPLTSALHSSCCKHMYVCTYIYVYRERELHALTEQNTGHEHNRCKWLTQESAHSHSFNRRLPCLNTALGINKFTADCSLGTLPLWIFQHHNRSNDHHWGQRTLHCIDSLERFGRISAVKLLDLAVAMLSPHKKSWQPAGPYKESDRTASLYFS